MATRPPLQLMPFGSAWLLCAGRSRSWARYQSLAFSPGMPLLDVGKQVCGTLVYVSA